MKNIRTLCIVALCMVVMTNIANAKGVSEALEKNKICNYPDYVQYIIEKRKEENKNMASAQVTYKKFKYSKEYADADENMMLIQELDALEEENDIDWNRSIIAYTLEHPKYGIDYMNNGVFDYLLSSPFLYVVNTSKTSHKTYSIEEKTCPFYTFLTDEAVDYIMDTETLEAKLLELGVNEVISCKVVLLFSAETILYIHSDLGDYAIMLNENESNFNSPDFENYEIYKMEDFLGRISLQKSMWIPPMVEPIDTSVLSIEKQEFGNEALYLREKGLLQGNENGLDLLKPLTRAEAITLLIRAMGLEETALKCSNDSIFNDMYNAEWAIPYATCAYEIGITTGTEEGLFNPDARVTSDQFATFVLRAMGQSDIDYIQGTEMLIEKGVITSEQAETMDLFTRGDMAKIIYEVYKNGLI